MHIVRKKLLWYGFGLILAGLAFATFGLPKKVALTVDDQSSMVRTWSITVQHLLNEQSVEFSEVDQIVPALDTFLTHGSKVRVSHASTIHVEVDNKDVVVHAVNPVPAGLLAQAGIRMHSGDILRTEHGPIQVDSVYKTQNDTHFWWVDRAKQFTLQDSTGVKTFSSTAATVGQALWEIGIKLTYSDRVTPSVNTLLTPNLAVSIQPARAILIQTIEEEYRLHTSAQTISEALVDAGLELQGLDYTIPAESEPIPNDGRVKLVRVDEDIIIEQTPIPFETVYEAVDDLEIDRQTVLEPGVYGIYAQRIRVRYENDLEVSRQVEEEWLASTPKDRIIGYGTKIVMHSIDTPDGTVDYWRALNVYAVSYKPSDTGGNITSTGQVLKKGIIAVNPNYIPYGTVLYVPGYGFGIAADTGRLSARTIDLGYSDEDYVSWHQNLTVYLVWPPPANVVWIIP